MVQKILLTVFFSLILILNLSKAQQFEYYDRDKDDLFMIKNKLHPSFVIEGLTQEQVNNIKLYSTRTLNLVLDSISSLRIRRVIRKETLSYMDASIFFINEAEQYSPSYYIRRQIEAIKKRFKLYPRDNYTQDLQSLLFFIEENAGNYKDFDFIKETLENLIEKAHVLDNEDIPSYLDSIEEKINIDLIDEPLEDAKTLIGIAKDHLKARKYKKASKSLELALEPLIQVSFRENLDLAVARELVFKGKLMYSSDKSISKNYIENALYFVNKAYYISSVENKDVIKGIRNQLRKIVKDFYNQEKVEKILKSIANQLKNL